MELQAMRDQTWWLALAADYEAAAAATGLGKSRAALALAMAVAEHETNNSTAWPGTNNFGAVQAGGLTPDELSQYRAGTLKAGDRKPGKVLHVDTHPPAQPYPVWFVAFDARVDGIAYFLRTLWRLSDSIADAPACTPMQLAMHMYMHGYYEGFTPGARPVGHRTLPLTAPEYANVDAYGKSVAACLQNIASDSCLGGWIGDTSTPVVTDPLIPPATDIA